MCVQQRCTPRRTFQTSFGEQQKMGQAQKGYKRKKNELRYAMAFATAADIRFQKEVQISAACGC